MVEELKRQGLGQGRICLSLVILVTCESTELAGCWEAI